MKRYIKLEAEGMGADEFARLAKAFEPIADGFKLTMTTGESGTLKELFERQYIPYTVRDNDVKDELLANLDTHQTIDTLSDKIAEAMADALKNGGNTLGEAMAKANETGIGVVVVDSEGRAVKQTNA